MNSLKNKTISFGFILTYATTGIGQSDLHFTSAEKLKGAWLCEFYSNTKEYEFQSITQRDKQLIEFKDDNKVQLKTIFESSIKVEMPSPENERFVDDFNISVINQGKYQLIDQKILMVFEGNNTPIFYSPIKSSNPQASAKAVKKYLSLIKFTNNLEGQKVGRKNITTEVKQKLLARVLTENPTSIGRFYQLLSEGKVYAFPSKYLFFEDVMIVDINTQELNFIISAPHKLENGQKISCIKQ